MYSTKDTTEKLNSRYFPVVGWAAKLHYIWGGWMQKSTSQDNTLPYWSEASSFQGALSLVGSVLVISYDM